MSNSPERAVKSNIPWSVKGIERDARETAKDAAKKEGMTVGEWLNKVIYTAGDPETSNGEIEGVKLKDIVTAIEHLSKRVADTETSGARAVDDLARNVGGVVERVQRLERVKTGADGDTSTKDIEQRLEHLESKSTDRQRIDALKALEKAVGYIALQFDTSHRAAIDRIETTENDLRTLVQRIEQGSTEASASAIGFLQEAVDGIAARISRVERAASEASRLNEDAAGEVDPVFVEQTGQRLRVLGDEIKRGGDHIRKLETIIGKLASQIDAAERRSSEGVQQVAETISKMREHFAASDAAETANHKRQIEQAVSAVSARTDQRIETLQSSFDQMITRLENVGAAARPTDATAQPSSVRATDTAPSNPNDRKKNTRAPEPEHSEKKKTGQSENVLAEVRDALGFDSAAAEAPKDARAEAPKTAPKRIKPEHQSRPFADDTNLGSLLEEEEEKEKPVNRSATSKTDDQQLNNLIDDTDGHDASPASKKPADYLKAARSKAKQAAEEKMTAAAEQRKRLSPKQRAILAAKIKRKNAAAQAAFETSGAASANSGVTPETDGITPSLISKVRAKIPRPTDPYDQMSATRGNIAHEHESDSKLTFIDAILGRPITAALGAAIVLVAIALLVLMKDTVFGNNQNADPTFTAVPETVSSQSGAEATIPAPEPIPETEAASTDDTASSVVRPRDLYAESVANLKAATSDTDIAAAMKGIEDAAALGHPPAQLQLGEIYKTGLGVEKDLDLAKQWFERAATGGNTLAMHRLGVMSARGDGGNVDNNASIIWFEKAANFGLVDSQYNLGATYHPTGDGNPLHDRAKAYFWYQIAAKNGDLQAGGLASSLAASMTEEARIAADQEIAAWQAQMPDPIANEVISAS